MLSGVVHSAVRLAEVTVNVANRLQEELRRIDGLYVVLPGDVVRYAVFPTPEVAISSVRLVNKCSITHR